MASVEFLKVTLASVANNKEELKRMGLENKVRNMESLVLKLLEDPKFCVDKKSEVDCNNYLDLVLKEMERRLNGSTLSNAN